MAQTPVARLMRIAWRSVGKILERVVADKLDQGRLDGLVWIGVDEVSHGADHKFLTCVADHLKERIVSAAPGRNAATLQGFFNSLSDEQKASITAVSIDMSAGYEKAIRSKDGVPQLATDALDEIRSEVWNQARREGHKQAAKELKGARFVLWKNPGKLTERQQLKLAHIQQTNKPLYRAYLISQQLREIYRVPFEVAVRLLDAWLAWARRCRLKPFVKLARTIEGVRLSV
jgi:transposase